MQTITLDSELRAKLNGLNKPLEILDEAGNTLGYYLPDSVYRHLLYAAVEQACPLNDAERERRRQEQGGSSLAEFWKRMGLP
jgi:hypothetical protein